MKVTWEVQDGYVGQKRPQTTEIDNQDLADCENEEQRRTLIHDVVQGDFDEKITFFINGEPWK